MGKYSIIYADPAWDYWGGRVKGSAKNHYPVMPLKDICALPVKEIAADDSLFVSVDHIPEAVRGV